MEALNDMSTPTDHGIIIPPNDDVENTTLGLLLKFNRLMKEEDLQMKFRIMLESLSRIQTRK